METTMSFNADVGRLRKLGYEDLADVAVGLCAYARAISHIREAWDGSGKRWIFKIQPEKGAFIVLKVQPRERNIELCLGGWPSDFSNTELPAKPKMGGGSYSACNLEFASQLGVATQYVENALDNFRRGKRPRR